MATQVFDTVRVGTEEATRVYVGATLVWEKGLVGDFFTENFRENF